MRYTWPDFGADTGNVVGSRLSDQIRQRFGLSAYSFDQAKDAALAELLAGTDSVITPEAYGAVGDGTTDDTAAIQAAVNAWVASTNKPVLAFSPKRYRTTSGVTATFTGSESTSRKVIAGAGAELYGDFAGGVVLTITISGAVNVRNLTVQSLKLRGLGASDTHTALLKIDGGTLGSGFLHRFVLRDVDADQFGTHGIWINGSAFEAKVDSCDSQAATANVTGACFYVTTEGSGTASSIDFTACNSDRGLYGIHAPSPMPGINVFGGTFIQAANHGINIGNCRNGLVAGAHVENCWQSGDASPAWATTQAGILISGYGTVIGCYGTDSTSKMRYVVRVFASPLVTVIGQVADGGTEYYLRADGAAGCQVTAISIPLGDTGAIHNGLPATGVLTQINTQGGPSFAVSPLTFTDADATPSVAEGKVFATANTGATTITDFDDAADGLEITVKVDANTTVQHNANIKLSSGADYVGSANDTLRLVSIGGVWYETGRSVNG